MANCKVKTRKKPGTEQIPAELIKAVDRTFRSEIHTLIYCIWNEDEFPEVWKESITVPIYKKGDKADCINYRGILLLSATYKMLPHILLSRLTPYAKELIGDHQRGFRRNRSATDHTVGFHLILEKYVNKMKQCFSYLHNSRKFMIHLV
jgi:hypothetical protein